MRELIEALVGTAVGLGSGFQAFPGPEPGRLHPDHIAAVDRHASATAARKLHKMIQRLRSKTPVNLAKYGKGRTHRNRRSSNS